MFAKFEMLQLIVIHVSPSFSWIVQRRPGIPTGNAIPHLLPSTLRPACVVLWMELQARSLSGALVQKKAEAAGG